LFSPFQIELAREVNRQLGGLFWLAFGMREREGRQQSHWTRFRYDDMADHVSLPPDGRAPNAEWVQAQIAAVVPDVVLIGGLGGDLQRFAAEIARARRIPFGFWLEPPRPRRSRLLRFVGREMLRSRLRQARFVLAIGDRAVRAYRGIVARTYLVPYGEDLSPCFDVERVSPHEGGVRFLFSGQLLPRHNLATLLKAMARVRATVDAPFTLTIAGYGPEQKRLDAILRRDAALRAVVRFDRDFGSWRERLRPFAENDALLYPASHSGWGLVVPEAMASGMPVLTTRGVEASRYFVRHGVSGLFVEPTVSGIARAVELWVIDPAEVHTMGLRAREAARDGHAPKVATSMVRAIRKASL
jgi:glycosyltransferase involved in cell wall biosynthesis